MRPVYRLRIALVVLCALFLPCVHPVSAAATDRLDMSVGMKTLPLLTNKISGDVEIAIIYDPANLGSRNDADEVKKIIDGGLDMPQGVKISSLMVPVSDLAKLSQAKIAYVTYGLKGGYDAIGRATSAAGVLTMSTDLECVKANICVLGLVSKPSVDIYYSKDAAAAARISFSSAFTMLVKQI